MEHVNPVHKKLSPGWGRPGWIQLPGIHSTPHVTVPGLRVTTAAQVYTYRDDEVFSGLGEMPL